MDRFALRGLALVSAGLWLSSLFMPCIWVDIGDSSALYYGRELLFLGVFGPIGGVVAWYAHLPWLFMMARMAFGKTPGGILATVAVAIAASFLGGFSMVGADEGVSGPAQFRIGVWFWLAAFLPPLVPGLMAMVRAAREEPA